MQRNEHVFTIFLSNLVQRTNEKIVFHDYCDHLLKFQFHFTY